MTKKLGENRPTGRAAKRKGVGDSQSQYGFNAPNDSPDPFDSELFRERLALLVSGAPLTAFAAQCPGVTEGMLRKYIAGTMPGLDKAVAIAQGGSVSLDWLAMGGADPTPASGAAAVEAAIDLMLDVVEGLGEYLQEMGVPQAVPPQKHRTLVEIIAREMMKRQPGDEDSKVVDLSKFRQLVDLAVG